MRLWLLAAEQGVLVQVWDGDHRVPEPRAIAPEAESGRGLLLVEPLCTGWGAYVPEGTSGKVVWAAVENRASESPS